MNNRQVGRRRGRGGQRPGGNPGRQDNGNRIDNRARGNAAQLLEKYKSLAADAQRSGDRVNTEYYLQFADHYFRVLSETRSRMEEGQQRRQQNDEDDGEDFGFEGEIGSPAAFGQASQRNDGGDDGGEFREERRPARRDREPRAARSEGDEDRGAARRDREPRVARNEGDEDRAAVRRDREPRAARAENDEDRGGARRERQPRPVRSDAVEDSGGFAPRSDEDRAVASREGYAQVEGDRRDARPAPANDEAQVERPRRGRPRRVAAVEDEGGETSFDAAVLPPAIASVGDAGGEEAAAERPRRGRPRRVRPDDEAVPPAA